MQIAKIVKTTKKIIRGDRFTQKSEILILNDNFGNYFVKKSGKLTKMSRLLAQEFFQNNFDDFWKYLALNKLHKKFPHLYTKTEALDIKKCYTDASKNRDKIMKKKINDHYEKFLTY